MATAPNESRSTTLSDEAPLNTAPSIASSATAGSDAHIMQLLQAIDALHHDLVAMQQVQQQLQQSLNQQQQMNIQIRLRWITDPNSHLSQMLLAWQEIALMPGLSTAQHKQAEAMYRLAYKHQHALTAWKRSLQQAIDQLSAPAYEDIIPKSEQPWLAWISEQFHLRKSEDPERRALAQLRRKLLSSMQQIELEQWPDAQSWHAIHAELLLKLQQQPSSRHTALLLPNQFDDIAQAVKRLRTTAIQWLNSYNKGEH